MKPKIKICGITNHDDLRLTVQLGADWIGYNFYPPSPRSISYQLAGQLIDESGGCSIAVGLFVNESLDEIRRALDSCPLKVIQLHGNETPDFCRQVKHLGIEVMKAFRIRDYRDLALLNTYEVDYYLLDAYHPSLYGGTGESFDWSWLKDISPDRKLFLAGGINPDNISEALTLGMYGIDLCSGIERDPGHKDPEKMTRLFNQINHEVP